MRYYSLTYIVFRGVVKHLSKIERQKKIDWFNANHKTLTKRPLIFCTKQFKIKTYDNFKAHNRDAN